MKDQVGTVYKVHILKTRSIAESRVYDSFGNRINQSGTTTTPLGFQGKYYDAKSGLNYFYYRYYNPAIGRFTTEDPVGVKGGLNMYSFVVNDPVDLTDPFGLYHYNTTPPQTVPVSGRTKEALECFEKCIQIATGNSNLDLLITGGAETRGHRPNSGHYRNMACDVTGPRYNPINFVNVFSCAGSCGFKIVLWEVYLNNPNRDHWHIERRRETLCEQFSCHL